MSSPRTLKAAENFALQLRQLNISASVQDIKNNEYLAKVITPLGPFALYTNNKGKVKIQTNLITKVEDRERAQWALDTICSRATIPPVGEKVWVAYTDGSAQNGQCGWSMVLFDPKGAKEYEKYGNLGPQSNGQIAGEVEGAIAVIADAVKNGVKKVLIRHDYEGIGKWATGQWRNKDADATRLKDWALFASGRGILISYEWTKGHNGDAGNERADELASKATLLKPSPRIGSPQHLEPKLDFSKDSMLL